jgi:crotonobetainyl-CoA:carnitine CoA-transferase CaiB-like acyl-CoA transferase
VRGSAPFVDQESAPFAMMNRNKRGFALDTRKPAAMAVFKRMLAKADVFVENYRHGAMEHFGIGYDQIKESCPRLVYCSITGFGRDVALPGYDLLVQAVGGLMSVTGEPDREPQKVGVALVDVVAGLLAANGILTALHHRARSGQGQRTNEQRVARRDELRALLEQALADDDAAAWTERLLAAGVPAGRVNAIDEAVSYAEELGLEPVVTLPRDDAPSVRLIRNPVRLSPATYRLAPPDLGS